MRSTPRAKPSFDGDLTDLGLHLTIVVGPAEYQFAALHRDSRKRDERVGGDRREQFRAEHLVAIIGAGKAADDLAGDFCALTVEAVTRLHRVLDQSLDLDDVAPLCALREVDQYPRHRLLIAPCRLPRSR